MVFDVLEELVRKRRRRRCEIVDCCGRKEFGHDALTDPRPHDARGDRELADVTHRMLCAVHEATDDRRRELRPAHPAETAKCCHIDRAKLRNRGINSRSEGAQDCRDLGSAKVAAFRLNRRELLRR